ncbi:MAG TPA: 16S rRNA (guanine(966)-N(2))-methyltransferase RsmD [Candidatus Limadaptatus stercoravium]|nr:16S rRNA (guanine(966)-N(2))-methyltransferase RsmD [Candidatus Limadaptatus stercoravium]
MRIVAGRYRGRKLTPPSDDSVRPTTDRIKETVFNILQWDVEGARVLDLFAGSGALGIECLSRGAAEVVFADKSPASVALIRQNLKGIEGSYRVLTADFTGVLRSGEDKFDLIFIDPPYKSGLGELAVDAAFDLGRVAEGGTVVYEHSSELPFKCAREDVKVRTKVMGSVTVEFIRKKTTGLVTGTFDPVTKGHMEVIEEALRLFDEVVVAVLVNPEKQCMFTPEERLALLNAALSDNTRVKTLYSEDYAVDVARRVGADKLVRGVRGEGDEAYENAMAEYNRAHGFDTVFVTPERYADVSSTRARELISKGDFRLLPENAIITAEEIIRRKGKP